MVDAESSQRQDLPLAHVSGYGVALEAPGKHRVDGDALARVLRSVPLPVVERKLTRPKDPAQSPISTQCWQWVEMRANFLRCREARVQ